MKRRMIALLLAMMFIISAAFVACGEKKADEPKKEEPKAEEPKAEEPKAEEPKAEEEESKRPAEPKGQLTRGSTTEATGDWIDYWQNNATDAAVLDLITGQGTVSVTDGAEYVIDNTTVKDYKRIENPDKSVTYEFEINEGLVYADGTPITAADQVAKFAFWAHPVIGEMGGQNNAGDKLIGYKEYSKGKAKTFKGVRLLGDYKFSVTINPEELPYFYELPMIGTSPTPIKFWTGEDDIKVMDDGEGVYLSKELTKATHEKKITDARNSREKFYSCGPYKIKSYDEAQKTVVLEVNDKYAGDYDGLKPAIKTLIFRLINAETAMDELKTGAVDLVESMMSKDEIEAGLDLEEELDEKGNPKFSHSTYPRAGYGKVTLVCDFGPTQFVEVRQALAHLLDRNEFVKAFTGGYGTVVNGPYGEGQWFYQETKKELNDKLNPYPYDAKKAMELLDQAGFVLDEKGQPWKEGSGIRHKKMQDGSLMPLVIEWSSTEKNQVAEILVTKLQKNPDLEKAGIKINRDEMTFGELLNWYSRDANQDPKYGVPKYGMYNLAVNFRPRYDMVDTYTTDPDKLKQGYNNNFLVDEKLEAAAKAMVKINATQKEEFKKAFVEFIERWNYLIPDLPLYSNTIHDFYTAKLKGFVPGALKPLTRSLMQAWVD